MLDDIPIDIKGHFRTTHDITILPSDHNKFSLASSRRSLAISIDKMKISILLIVLAATVCYCADLEQPIDNSAVPVNEVPKDSFQDQPVATAEIASSDPKETDPNSEDLATAQQLFLGIGFGGGGYGGGWGRGYGGYGRGFGGGWGRGFGGGYGRRFGYGGGWGWGR